MPWTYISSFMVAPKIKSLIFYYYFRQAHTSMCTCRWDNLGSYISVIISVCYSNKTFRFQNSLAYPPVFLTDFAYWAKSVRSTLWKVLLPNPCLWPTGMYNKAVFTYVLLYQHAKKVVSDSLVTRLVDFNIVIGLVNSVVNLPYWQMNFFEEIHITEEL